MRWAPGSERGSVTAEFVVALPAVMLVLTFCLGALRIGAQQVRLQDAAAAVARSVARGGDESAARGASVTRHDDGDLVCVRLAASAGLGSLQLVAESCALADGG